MTVAWLSGSSDPARAALHPDELTLVRRVADGGGFVASNFPWPDAPGAYRPVPLPVASVRNVAQFWRVRLSPAYRRFVTARVDHLLAVHPGTVRLITGSQGLELLRHAWPALDATRLRVASLGPVAGRLPAGLEPLIVRSPADLLSRVGWRGLVHAELGTGHLNYATDPAVIEHLRRWVAAS